MKKLRVLFAVALLCTALQAGAREVVAIVNQPNLPVLSGSGKALTDAQVKQVIQAAAMDRQWTLAEPTPGRLLATRQWNGKHTIVTEINYAADKYSLIYKDSINMNYQQRNGEPMIHPHYNRFTRELNDSIRIGLGKL